MLCIIRMENCDIKGWFTATDVHDARHKAQGAHNNALAAKLYQMEFVRPGKHDLGDGYTMLVDA